MRGLILAALALAGMATVAEAQSIQRTELFRQAYPPGYETVTVRAVVPKGGVAAAHIHPGLETGYILSGEGRLRIEGQPERVMKAGDSVMMPIKTPHDMTNIGPDELVILSTYVLEAGQPVAIPVK